MGVKLFTVNHGEKHDSIHDLIFYCPGCDNVHGVTIRDVDVSRLSEEDKAIYEKNDNPKWSFNGNFKAPTFEPSIHVHVTYVGTEERRTLCHSFVKDGKIQFLNDCVHSLKGQTVDLPDVD